MVPKKKIMNPVQIVPKKFRMMPHEQNLSLRPEELKKGIYNLTTGKRISDLWDFTMAFQSNDPTIVCQKKTLNHFQKKFVRKEVPIQMISNAEIEPETENKEEKGIFITEKEVGKVQIKHPRLSSLPEETPNIKKQRKPYIILTLHSSGLIEGPKYRIFKAEHLFFWPQIKAIISKLTEIMVKLKMENTKVLAEELVVLAQTSHAKTYRDFCSCFQAGTLIYNGIKTFLLTKSLTPDEKDSKDVYKYGKVQAFCRMVIAMKIMRVMRVKIKKTISIQRSFRLHRIFKQTKERIFADQEKCYKGFLSLQEGLKAKWKDYSKGPRVEIHLNSWNVNEDLRKTIYRFSQRKNAQISRIFLLRDPSVEIVYVLPFELPNDVQEYFFKILELSGIQNFTERLHFVFPEKSESFNSNLTVTRCLLYSPNSLKRLKAIIADKFSYIVPSQTNYDEIKLSVVLESPILGIDPLKFNKLASKIGSKKFFSSCKLPVIPFECDFKNEEDLIERLTLLILKNPKIRNWIFKIDDEINSRGIAVLSLDSLKILNHLRELYSKKDSSAIEKAKNVIFKVIFPLIKFLQAKLRFATPSLFKGYNDYISQFISRNGILEAAEYSSAASFSIFAFISPDGVVSPISCYEKIQISEYRNIGILNPQILITNLDFKALAGQIGIMLANLGAFGYFNFDFLAVPDPENSQNSPIFYGCGVGFGLNDYNCGVFLYEGLTDSMRNYISSDGRNNNSSNIVAFNELDRENYFLYIPFLVYNGLAELNVKTFFDICRQEGISFDLENRQGITFVPINSISNLCIGLLCAGDSQRSVLKTLTDALNIFPQSLPLKQIKDEEYPNGHDLCHFMDLLHSIRRKNKALEKFGSLLYTASDQRPLF